MSVAQVQEGGKMNVNPQNNCSQPINIKTSFVMFKREVYYIPEMGYYKVTNVLGIDDGKVKYELSPTKTRCGRILRKNKYKLVDD